MHCNLLRVMGGGLAAVSLFLAKPAMASDYAISGASDTILRMGTTSTENKNIYPLYEYLRLSVISAVKDGGTLSLHLGGWGRADLADKSSRDGGYADGDLQFGYLSYQGAKNNFVVNAGRQFVTEGVAAQLLDGLYTRSDLAAGFAAAVYAGAPVVTEPNLKADDFIYGGRVSQSNYKYYTLGISALQSVAGSSRYREEEGIDLWLHPMSALDVTGRSSYNSITNGWMEHAYTVSCSPLDNVKLFADLSNINYRDYFYRVTTTALVFNPLTNGIDPNEKLLTLGGGGSYTLFKNITVAADYKHYDYDIARAAEYYGGKISYAIPSSFGAGFSVHRMDGGVDRLKFTEYRVYAMKKLGKADLTVDFIDLNYDNAAAMNEVKDAVTVVAAGSYELSKALRLAASLDYSHNPFFDNEVKGLVKLSYLFDVKRSAEGGTKSEK
jgi:hypothetical protein